MKSVAIAILGLLLFVSLASANHPMTDDGRTVSFSSPGGNEWWVEVYLQGTDASTVSKVEARDADGPWTHLTMRSWGAWAASFHVQPGSDVLFRATWSDADQVHSCWFTHPEGAERCTDSDRPASYYGTPGPDMANGVAVAQDGVIFAGRSLSDVPSQVTAAKFFHDLRLGILWAHTFGGSDSDEAFDVAALGRDGIVVGRTESHDFPTVGTLPHDVQFSGPTDGFVTRINDAQGLAWSTYFGGSDHDRIDAVTVAADGTIIVAGWTSSCDFPTTPGAFQQPSGTCQDAFVARFSGDGQLLVATVYGGSSHERGLDVAIAPNGDIVLFGVTESFDLPTTPGAYDRVRNAEHADNLYVARFSPDLSALVAATYFGSPTDHAWVQGGMDVDATGVYLTGSTTADDWPTSSDAWATTLQSPTGCQDGPATFNGPCWDGFVSKLDPDLAALVYSTYLGGTGHDMAASVAVDGAGRAHVTGDTDGGTFVAPANGQDHGFRDAFHAVLSADGSSLEELSAIGGAQWDGGNAVTYDGFGYVVGFTESEDFATSGDAAFREMRGYRDMFIVQVAQPEAPLTFDHRGGNEWWVQVDVQGAHPSRVQAMDTNGPWTDLTLRHWGDWAASFRIEPGHDVRFRAMVDGAWQESCWFTHPGGKTPDGSQTCGTSGEVPPPPTGDFDATFQTSGGNDWWVEVYVDGNEPLAAVHARDDGGAWIALEKKSWGSWAKSFHVHEGSIIEFRATSTDGETDVSGGYRWPTGTSA